MNRFTPASLTFDLSSSREPKVESMAAPSAGLGSSGEWSIWWTVLRWGAVRIVSGSS